MRVCWFLPPLASLWRVPVEDEPGGVNGGDQPAVGAEHVEKQHATHGACGQRSHDQGAMDLGSVEHIASPPPSPPLPHPWLRS